MQFALGSVLKLTRSAFGGLGSFRAPSIRRALPVLLGGLLCAVVSPAMAQSIESISLTSTPTGGPTGSPNTVYVIGDTITFTIDYDANLLVAPGSPTLRFKIGAQSRTANCAGQANTSRLLCSYVVKEGDEDNQDNNITVDGGVQLVGGNVPDRSPGGLTGGRPNKVDGSRLKLNDITASGVVNSYGFNAGSTITLMLQFGDGTALEPDMSNTGAMGATLVLENAERSARYVDTNGGTVRFNYAVVAGDNGAFGLKLTGVDALADKNGNQGLATGWESTVARELAGMDVTQRRVDTRGPRLTQILFRGVGGALVGRDDPTPDVPSKPVSDGSVVFDVFFDEPIEAVNATLRVTVGQTTFSTAACTGTDTFDSEWMRCNLQVGAASGWLDTDGLSTPSNPLNYTTLRDALGNPATPAFAPQRFPDIKVDSVPPTVTSATIRVPRAEINSNVIVRVTFSEDVDVTGTPEAAISFTNNLGGSQDDVAGNAVYSSVSGRVVEFRAPISSLPERTTTTTSIIAKLASVGEGIVDMAGNPAGVPDVDDTAASKTGVTITLRATPTDGELGDQYADKTAPTLERISLGGEVKKVYGLDDATPIQFDVLFSEPVTATDASLDLRIGTSPKPAELTAVTDNGARFTAIYDPVSGDTGTVAVSGIKLDAGGKIEDLNGRGWENANCAVKQAEEREDCRDDLSNSNRKDASKISKSLTGSARVDTTRPKVKSVTLLTTPAPGAVGNDRQRYYGAGETVRIQVTMDEDVVVPAGAEIVIGVRVTGAVSDQASFKLLRGKRDLIFEYKVAATDCSSGVSENCHIALNGIGVTGFVGPHASIKDVGGNACEASGSDGTCGYTWPSAPSGNHGVDARLSGDQKLTPLEETTTPGVQTVPVSTTTVVRSTTPTGGYYQAGDTITIEVSLSPAVTFTSAPQLLVNFDEGGSQRLTPGERISSSGTPTTRLTYSYQVASGDEDLDGFTASLSGGGTPTVEDGRRATLGSVSVRGIRIDALAPELEPPLRITSRARSGSTYVAGEEIEVTATFSEAVKRTSLGEEPKLTILIGGEERAATQQSPSSTAANDEYVFGYTVVAGDNGDVTIAANALESSLEDAAGNAASDSHPALSASTSHRVDTQAPSVTDVKVTGSGDDTCSWRATPSLRR